MNRMKRFQNIGILLLLISIVFFCTMGCAEEQEDDLKRFSLSDEEETLTEPDTEEVQEKSENTQTESSSQHIYVYVCGAVESPGVYELECGARIYEAISSAGGLREDADRNYVNQAQVLSDGEQIYIPTQEEAEQGILTSDLNDANIAAADDKININTASKEELMTLNGIGESRAEKILAYRQSQGEFQSIDELMNVEGIKEGIFQKIKDRITVKTGS